jgi:hypothetical protein
MSRAELWKRNRFSADQKVAVFKRYLVEQTPEVNPPGSRGIRRGAIKEI